MRATVRTESVVMLGICGLTGVWFWWTRGFWAAAPLCVIASVGLALHLLPPIPREQRGLTGWSLVNLVGLVVALVATWRESLFLLMAGLLLVVVAIAVPSLQRRS